MLPYQAGLWLKSCLGRCILCRLQPIQVGYLCYDCDNDIDWLPDVFEVATRTATLSIQAASSYNTVMAQAIFAYKEDDKPSALPFLVHALSKLADSLELPEDTLIVPVPTTQGRLIARGFYPVGVLVRYLSALMGFEVYDGVVRCGEQLKQRSLNRADRLTNLTDVFEVIVPPTSRTLLLFDDVSTTGATFVSLADCLWDYDSDLQIAAVCLAHGRDL